MLDTRTALLMVGYMDLSKVELLDVKKASSSGRR